ncbi:hypothetical protein CF70_035045 [Cupriavidus sp. SK-3]|uniref:phasin family protein n=1 Tax=Cupriavidus sp. SK-3 TaxID=1470558 RepID=UPI000445974D|nr:phasin family protein [Cupriavidus sp. SK-3]KDP87680.1 hypothetical protein CF70_035045 [Cupriavidus sp. SK-3]
MSTGIPEQSISAQKAGVERFLGLATIAFEGIEKLAQLNLQAVKSSFAGNQGILSKTLSANNQQERVALPLELTQPIAEKAASYSRQVSEILSSIQGEFSTAAQAHLQQCQRDAQELFENLAKNAPTGSESALAAWQSALSTPALASDETAKKSKKHLAHAEGAGPAL